MIGSVQHQTTKFGCMAAVAAMIADVPVRQVYADIGHDGSKRPFKFLEIAAWLNSRGYHLGAFSKNSRPSRMVRMEWSRNISALAIVAAADGYTHAVYWTGAEVRDPEPKNAGRELADYHVEEWWPIIRISDRG